PNRARSLVGTFDTQKATVEKLGPTEDYVRLQLLLTDTESRYDKEAATTRLLETYYYVEEVQDMEVKANCTARLVASLSQIEPQFASVDTREVSETSSRELDRRIKLLLGSTADHSLTSRRIIEALARNKPALALEVVLALNTEERRD